MLSSCVCAFVCVVDAKMVPGWPKLGQVCSLPHAISPIRSSQIGCLFKIIQTKIYSGAHFDRISCFSSILSSCRGRSSSSTRTSSSTRIRPPSSARRSSSKRRPSSRRRKSSSCTRRSSSRRKGSSSSRRKLFSLLLEKDLLLHLEAATAAGCRHSRDHCLRLNCKKHLSRLLPPDK